MNRYLWVEISLLGMLWSGTASFSEDVLDIIKKGEMISDSGYFSLSVSPGSYMLEGAPQERVSDKLTIYNNTQYDMQAKVKVMSVHLDEKGMKNTSSKISDDSLAHAIQIIPDVFNIPMGSYRTVTVSIQIPKEMVGTNYAAISAQGARVERVEGKNHTKEYSVISSVGISPELISQVTLTIKGKSSYNYDLREIKVIKPDAKKQQMLNIVAKVKNTGNAQFPMMLSAVLLQGGNLVARIKPKGKYFLKPGIEYEMTCNPSARVLEKGKYDMVVTLTSDREELKLKEIHKEFEIK